MPLIQKYYFRLGDFQPHEKIRLGDHKSDLLTSGLIHNNEDGPPTISSQKPSEQYLLRFDNELLVGIWWRNQHSFQLNERELMNSFYPEVYDLITNQFGQPTKQNPTKESIVFICQDGIIRKIGILGKQL